MQVQTILNGIDRHGQFVYESVRWSGADKRGLEVSVRARKNSKLLCSGCGRPARGYDRLPKRDYQYVPLWGLTVWLLYTPRRVECRGCGVKVEKLPWSDGKSRLTIRMQWFLAGWAKRLSWREVARAFGTTWDSVFRSVKMAVSWGLAHRSLEGIEAIGVDEIAWRKGHQYLTLVYQIDAGCKRLLWIGKDRTRKTLKRFFRRFGKRRCKQLRYVCSDMWKPYLGVIARRANQAVHVLDRFHIMKLFNKAIDKVRAEEARRLVRDGYQPVLKHSRWCLLKRKPNLTAKQTVKLTELLQYNLRTVKAYLMREEFQRFWRYKSLPWAAQFFVEWCDRASRSRIEPMQKLAKTLDIHGEQILNWFLAKGTISAGVVEGLNNKVKLTMRKAFGFRTQKAIKTALYHALGKLPEPKFAHEFC